MALRCPQFDSQNPFGSSNFKIFLAAMGPEAPDAAPKSAEAQKKEAKEKVEAADLLPKSVEHLNKLIEAAPESEAQVILDNLNAAIQQLAAIDRSRDFLGEDGVKLAEAAFDAAYGDFTISPTEIRELAQVRADAEIRLDLIQAHQVKDETALANYVMLFLREDGKTVPQIQSYLDEGVVYTADFTDPSTGRKNDFAEDHATLGMIMKASGTDHLKVTKSSGKNTEAYLWDDGKAYDKPKGSTEPKHYVELLQSYKFSKAPKVEEIPEPEKEEAPVVAPKAQTETERQETYNPDFEDGSMWMTPEELAQAKAEDATADASGELRYHRSTEIYTGSEHGHELTARVDVSPSSPEVTLDSLKGKSVEVPGLFRGESSYEQIAKIKYLENGKAVYDAIRMMAAIHRQLVGPIDNRNMWESLRGGILSKGGRWEIAFNEMVKAVYGKNENKIDDSFPYIKEFKAAAKALLDNMSKLKDTGADAESYKAQREEVEYSGEKADMARSAEQVFDPYSYGPPIAFDAFQAIAYTFNRKDRPTVNEDCWMSPAARSNAAYSYKRYGETEVISQARAFDKLMETGNVDAYVTKMNLYIDMGAAHLNSQADHLYKTKKQKEKHRVTAPHITAEQVKDPDFQLTEDQVAAARHGAMIFAAQELAVYQRVEAERNPSDDPIESAARKAAADAGLDETETQAIVDATQKQLYAVAGAYAAVHDFNNLDEWASYSAGLVAGAQLDLGHGLRLEFLAQTDSVLPIIRTSAGLIYEFNFGKEKRWGAELYAKIVMGTAVPEAVAGFDLGYEMGPDRIWRADVINVSVSSKLTASGSIGVERNLGRVFDKRIREYREKHKEEVDALEEEAFQAIDDLDVSTAQKKALKEAYSGYLDQQIAFHVSEDFNVWYKQVKFVGVGIVGAVGLKEGGLAVGPYLTIGIGFHAVTLYVPPLETPEDVAYSMQTGLPVESKDYKMPEPDWVKVDVSDRVLWSGETSTQEAAVHEAETRRDKALETMQEGVKGDVILTPQERYTAVDFQALNGTIQFYVDGRAGIEGIQDGPQNLAMNLDSRDNLIVRILEIPAAQGGDNIVVVGITNRPDASMDEIVNNSGNMLTWNQTLDGKKSDSTLMDNPRSSAADSIFTLGEADMKVATSAMQLGDLRLNGAKDSIRTTRYEDIRARGGVEAASERFTEAEKELAVEVANELITAGFGYKKLILPDQADAIHAKIRELYTAKGKTDIGDDIVKLTHQYAMEIDRPQKDHIPLDWNKDAFETVAGSFSHLASEYWESHKAEIMDGSMDSAFPEGAEFMVTINAKGEMVMLGGYYNNEVYGAVIAPIKWDTKNPAETLRTLGVEDNEENRKAVLEVANAIYKLEWEEKPLSNVDFKTASETMVGDKLLTTQVSDDLFGPADGAKLREMAKKKDPTLYPELAKEYAQAVADLLANKQASIRGNPVTIDWEVYCGLDDNCYNLTFARNIKLVYERPAPVEVKAASTRVRVESGMAPELTEKYTNVTLRPSLIPIKVTPELDPPTSDGDGTQDPGTVGDHPNVHLGETVPELGGQGENDAGHF